MTAVEWLYNELSKNNTSTDSVIERIDKESSIWKQAKAMEQQQLKEMYLKGIENYDPTFKRKSQWTEVDNMTKRLK
jgi:hypothetical protein